MSEEKYYYHPASDAETEYTKLLFVISPFFFVAVMAFSPLISAIVLIFILLGLGNKLDKKATIFCSVLAIMSVVLIYSSRGFYPLGDGADDVNVYYENYKSLLNYNYKALFQYGGGLEVGLPLYMYVIGEICGDITRSQLLIIVGMPIGIALICWFYSVPAKLIPSKYHALLMGGIVVFYSYSASNLLLRQFFASVILLYALSSKSRLKSYLLLVLSASFHITSVPFYFIYKLYVKKRYGDYYFLLFFAFLFFSLTFLGDIISLLGMNALALKLSYYSPSGSGTLDVDLAVSLNKMTLILLGIGTVYIISSKFLSSISGRLDVSFNRNARAVFFMLVCTLISMHLAWFPTRLFLIPVYFVLPVIMFHAVERRTYLLMQVIFVMLLCQRITSWIPFDISYTELWMGYPWWSSTPFYYLF